MEPDISQVNVLDSNKRVGRWPKRQEEKLAVLRYLASKFEVGRDYSEPEVNAIINAWHSFGDHALIRREMYQRFLVDRSPDGRVYSFKQTSV